MYPLFLTKAFSPFLAKQKCLSLSVCQFTDLLYSLHRNVTLSCFCFDNLGWDQRKQPLPQHRQDGEVECWWSSCHKIPPIDRPMFANYPSLFFPLHADQYCNYLSSSFFPVKYPSLSVSFYPSFSTSNYLYSNTNYAIPLQQTSFAVHSITPCDFASQTKVHPQLDTLIVTTIMQSLSCLILLFLSFFLCLFLSCFTPAPSQALQS